MRPPCQTPEQPQCPKRKAGCHAECPDWAKWEAYKAEIYEARKRERDALEAMRETGEAVRKRWLKNQKDKGR